MGITRARVRRGNDATPNRFRQEQRPQETAQGHLSGVVIGAGFNFDNFVKWGRETGNLPDDAEFISFDDIPEELAIRCTTGKAPERLARDLKMQKGLAGMRRVTT